MNKQQPKPRCIAHKVALLGGSDFYGFYNDRYSRFDVDGEKVLLAYTDKLTAKEINGLGHAYNARVITAQTWADNMAKSWQPIREKLLQQLSETRIWVVILHQVKGFQFEATIKSCRIDVSEIALKNQGIPFRTEAGAINFCKANDWSIRP